MKWVLTLDEIEPASEVGGKARALATLKRQGLNVPEALCLPADTYRRFVVLNGLDQQINLELGKKDFANMRWEEIWDISLRLRNRFVKAAMPLELSQALEDAVGRLFGGQPVSVRSSALAEDSAEASFAGLHESFVNLRGVPSILKHIKLVWASLWSDRALLYRQELGLDPYESAMAVVVQLMVVGDCSGVAFSMNPLDSSHSSVEAVHGLNQGLVDGSIEPDHWELDRAKGLILEHRPARRELALRAAAEGVVAQALTEDMRERPPLSPREVVQVYGFSRELEAAAGAPQDMEWTKADDALFILQSRNITTLSSADGEDERPRYLGLKRSLENLKGLRRSIEEQVIPGMESQHKELAGQDLGSLSDEELAAEIMRRKQTIDYWVDVYWRECIPFAHGMRLFGQVYNDRIAPQDPYEFMHLLTGVQLQGVARNRMLYAMADMILAEPALAAAAENNGDVSAYPDFLALVDDFIAKFGGAAWSGQNVPMTRGMVARLAARYARGGARQRAELPSNDDLVRAFLESFSYSNRHQAEELLDIAKASYRLRDDDNIYLGRLEGELARSLREATRRLEVKWGALPGGLPVEEVVGSLEKNSPPTIQKTSTEPPKARPGLAVKARQLVGQPASAGFATGTARVVLSPGDLFAFQNGEVLVCDAIDPNMTFIVPLASAIVERRGGMLIHGAIIAREHGIPCVTGVPEAASLIRTGEQVSVDGYLGLVIIGSNSLQPV